MLPDHREVLENVHPAANAGWPAYLIRTTRIVPQACDHRMFSQTATSIVATSPLTAARAIPFILAMFP
jgi:hypothetical protein